MFILPLKFYQLTGAQTLVPRLGEIPSGESLFAFGFPGGTGPEWSLCENSSGTLAVTDQSIFFPAQEMLCSLKSEELNGMSGGPILDKRGRYVGMLDYVMATAQRPNHRVGFVPYRVLKPMIVDDKLTALAYVRGYTFTAYEADTSGGTRVHANFEPATGLKSLEIKSSAQTITSVITKLDRDNPRADITVVGEGWSARYPDTGVYWPSSMGVKFTARILTQSP